MSRIKELKTSPENIINMVDLFSLLCPEGKESKYVDLLLRIMKNTTDIDDYSKKIIQHFNVEFGVPKSTFKNFSPIQIVFYFKFLESSFNEKDIKSFHNFCKYNERGLISQNDLTKYKSITQIIEAIDLAEIKISEKQMEKQIVKLYEDNEWLTIRPLTFDSSRKYGSSTKWCTTTENNPDYFVKYARNGILIYNINKKNGVKVACYIATNGEDEFSFWNQKDVRIDSLQTDLPIHILEVIKKEVKNNYVDNLSLLPDELQTGKDTKLKSRLVSGLRNAIEREDESEAPDVSPIFTDDYYEMSPPIDIMTTREELTESLPLLRRSEIPVESLPLLRRSEIPVPTEEGIDSHNPTV